MSHRVSTKTEITDKGLAIAALTQAGISFRESGDQIHLTSGDVRNAVINLKTGEISGDTDYQHTTQKFGVLRQFYSEAKFLSEAAKTGTIIEQRDVDHEGNIVLTWSMG